MRRIIPIIILLAAIGGGYWWFTQQNTVVEAEELPLVGSGSVEAETVLITAELGGRIVDIKVGEGQEIEAGQVLVELDKEELLAQQLQLESNLAAARANLNLVSAPPRPEDIAAARARLQQAQATRDGAKLTWERAQQLADNPHQLEVEINRARSGVTRGEKELELALVNLKRQEIAAEAASRDQSSHEALVKMEAAQRALEAARIQVDMAEVGLAGAEKQVEHLVGMRNRPLQLMAEANTARAAYEQAQAAVLAAEASLAAASAPPRQEDVEVALAQLNEAKAALTAVEVQLDKQTLTAPRAGLISKKAVEAGELAAPGTVLLELSDIDTVDITVYIPETRIGEVKIGQKAIVEADAYEDRVFEGMVTFIAHEAEFTPRNVQTEEERVNLVFAVKISLDNADHLLKPGMPADATILAEMADPTPVPTATPTPKTNPTRTPTPKPTATPMPTTGPTAAQEAAPPPQATTPATLEPQDIHLATEAEIVTRGLKVRSGPGIDHPVVSYLAQGEVVPVINVDQATGWLQVQLPSGDKVGWISSRPEYVAIR